MQPESSTTDAVSDTPAADPPLTPGSLGSFEQPLGAQQTGEQAELTDTEFAALGLDLEQHGLDTDLQGVLSHTAFSQVGLNIRPADAIVFKVEYHFAFAGSPGTKLKVLAMQLAWAF